MSPLGYVLFLTAAICCTAAPASDGSCPMPPRLTEAELQDDWDSDSYPQGKIAIYLCRPGYSRLGTIKKICAEGKWAILSSGQCKKKNCGHPGDLENGRFEVINDDSFDFGAIVEYSCEVGYQMASRERRRQCTASGWSNYVPECNVRNCPPIEAASNIKVLSTVYDEAYSVGHVVRFECKDPNHMLNGPYEIFCTSVGEWSSDPPTCKEISCTIPKIENGNVDNIKNVYKNKDLLLYTCIEGFQATKNGEATCTKDGWNPNPSCSEITCSSNQAVTKGKLVAHKPVYKYGEEIDVECDDGYRLQSEPNTRRKCTENGWYPPSTCVQNCEIPRINHGRYSSSFWGNSHYYICDEYYYPRDWIQITCTRTGWNPEPRCSRQCSYYDAVVQNAELENPRGVYLEGETVKFQCRKNYQTPDGKNFGERTCLPNGEFSSAICYRICEAPNLQNGKFSSNKDEFQLGDYLQYECDKGYMTKSRSLLGSAQCLSRGWSETPSCIPITCVHDGFKYYDGDVIQYKCGSGKRAECDVGQCFYYGWGPPRVCKDILCTIPDTLDLILSPTWDSYPVNKRVSISCKEGFERDGPLNIHCTENGWNPPLPICKAVVPTPKPETNDDVPTPNPDEKHVEHPNEADSVAPPSGSKNKTVEHPSAPDSAAPRPGSKNERVVHPSAPDSADPPPDSKNKKEERKKCPCAYTPKNAEIIDLKEEYYSNDKITMKCLRGYKQYGSSTIQCIDGKWEQPLECIKSESCNNPPALLNGYIIESSKREEYVTDDEVQYGCNSGYQIIGSDKSTCMNNKQWSAIPRCIENPCGKPPKLNFATVVIKKGTFSHGEKVKYTCIRGYEISATSGDGWASCLKGEWWNIPTCVETSCGTPPKISNGKYRSSRTKSTYEAGERFTYVCDTGYSLEGSGDALCKNKQWIELPVCRRTGEQCGPPPHVPSGDTDQTRKANYKSGEFVTYRCPSYYVLKGERTVRCTNGVWSEAPECLEPCTASEKDMAQNNIELRWTGQKKLYSEHGKPMEFKCKSGYEAPSGTNMRTTCDQGKLQYPKCFRSGFCELQQNTMVVNNIHYNISSIVDNGQTVTFQCTEGMTPENKLKVQCENGNINYPRCTASKSCETPKVLNGFIRSEQQASYDSGSNVEFDCNEDYVIKGSINVICQNGKWDNLPVCQRPCKVSLEELTKRNIQLASSENFNFNKKFKHDEELTVTCKSGFRRPNQGDLRIVCEDGKFSYTRCFSGNTCRIDQDEVDTKLLELDESHNNEVHYAEGEEIKFNCKAGSRISGQHIGRCSNEGLEYPDCRGTSSV
ncbi:complement factor H [Leptodactylus fuscus]|uniref:complement factor H n=1 Tax=Leptodactylus fuscus TaxID=238119 RepID=UPI003F4EEBB6